MLVDTNISSVIENRNNKAKLSQTRSNTRNMTYIFKINVVLEVNIEVQTLANY